MGCRQSRAKLETSVVPVVTTSDTIQDFGWDEADDHLKPQGGRGIITRERESAISSAASFSYRPGRLILVRHGESEANVDRKLTATVPDHMVHLTATGRAEAIAAGVKLRELIGKSESLAFIISPYVRTRETFNGIARAFGPVDELNVRQEVHIREMEYGNYDDAEIESMHIEKGEFGQFWYRFANGESCADVYNRASLFLESLYHRWEHSREENLVVVSHGVFLLVFLMRLFRYSIDEYYMLDRLRTTEIIVMERTEDHRFYDLSFTWPAGSEKNFHGLRKKPKEPEKIPVWDGDPEAELMVSKAVKGTKKAWVARAINAAIGTKEPERSMTLGRSPSGNQKTSADAPAVDAIASQRSGASSDEMTPASSEGWMSAGTLASRLSQSSASLGKRLSRKG